MVTQYIRYNIRTFIKKGKRKRRRKKKKVRKKKKYLFYFYPSAKMPTQYLLIKPKLIPIVIL
jgi:hypothetical protein